MNSQNYGFSFNNIQIKDNLFIKEGKNQLGIDKIQKETEFYLYITNNNIPFSIPRYIDSTRTSLTIEYLKNTTTLTNNITQENIDHYYQHILQHLEPLHKIEKETPIEQIKQDILYEIETKVIERYHKTDWTTLLQENKIKTINNIPFKTIEYYIQTIKTKVMKILDNKNPSTYQLIHGDIHLGNILVENEEENLNPHLYFIDPRGFFGKTQLFGLKEYDEAKLLFGLSGYSIFDTMEIENLDIDNNGNLNIDWITHHEYLFLHLCTFKTPPSGAVMNVQGDADCAFSMCNGVKPYLNELQILLCLSIWLGNNSCFINPKKKITSLMIAFYYCEKILDRI